MQDPRSTPSPQLCGLEKILDLLPRLCFYDLEEILDLLPRHMLLRLIGNLDPLPRLSFYDLEEILDLLPRPACGERVGVRGNQIK